MQSSLLASHLGFESDRAVDLANGHARANSQRRKLIFRIVRTPQPQRVGQKHHVLSSERAVLDGPWFLVQRRDQDENRRVVEDVELRVGQLRSKLIGITTAACRNIRFGEPGMLSSSF